MNYRQLHSFIVLAEELHFGNAAARLNIVQPALSQQIKALEQSLKIQLFYRDKRNVALTFEGEMLVEKARTILLHCDQFYDSARSLRQGFTGQLKLGYVGSSILDPALTLLISSYHQKNAVEIVIEEHNVHDQLALLLNNQLDIGLVRLPIPCHDELEYFNIATRALVAVLPRHHPQANKQKVALSTLSGDLFFMQKDPPGIGLGESALSACKQAGFVPRKIQYAHDVSSAIGLVAMGLGITLVPETQRSVMLANINYCQLTDVTTTTTLALCWPRRSKNKVLKDFIHYAKELTRESDS